MKIADFLSNLSEFKYLRVSRKQSSMGKLIETLLNFSVAACFTRHRKAIYYTTWVWLFLVLFCKPTQIKSQKSGCSFVLTRVYAVFMCVRFLLLIRSTVWRQNRSIAFKAVCLSQTKSNFDISNQPRIIINHIHDHSEKL